jgi:competence protein ComGF
MKRFRLSTLLLLIVIAALSIALVVQHVQTSRREAELQARLAQSWPLFLKQQREEGLLRQTIEAMQRKHREELAKRSPGEVQQQEREDAELNRDIEAMDQRYREERSKKELAKASEAEAWRRPK